MPKFYKKSIIQILELEKHTAEPDREESEWAGTRASPRPAGGGHRRTFPPRGPAGRGPPRICLYWAVSPQRSGPLRPGRMASEGPAEPR